MREEPARHLRRRLLRPVPELQQRATERLLTNGCLCASAAMPVTGTTILRQSHHVTLRRLSVHTVGALRRRHHMLPGFFTVHTTPHSAARSMPSPPVQRETKVCGVIPKYMLSAMPQFFTTGAK